MECQWPQKASGFGIQLLEIGTFQIHIFVLVLSFCFEEAKYILISVSEEEFSELLFAYTIPFLQNQKTWNWC